MRHFLRVFVFCLSVGCVQRCCLSQSAPDGGDDARPAAQTSDRPTLYLIGDSTVKNGQGDGAGGMWGWGQVLAPHFDPKRIRIENRALGGRSSRTYLTEGLWQGVLDAIKPGDFVLIQFGHNDGGEMFASDRPRASIKGNGEETREGVVEATGSSEVVHSFGWYLRRYAADAQARGATPIVLSLVPRDIWRDDRVARADNDYGKWAREAARDSGAEFVDLNARVADRYESDGQPKVHSRYFTPQDHTHTSKEGAEVNAQCVADGVRGLVDCRLRDYLVPAEPKAGGEPAATKRFDFGPGKLAPGHTRVLASDRYLRSRGYGFEPHSVVSDQSHHDDPLAGDCCAGEGPFFFSTRLPEGNYRVRVVACEGTPRMTVKAELRRLMVEQSEARTSEFVVNVRTPTIGQGPGVGLKPREKESEAWAWDDKLTLEFNGKGPKVAALVIEPVAEATTVFLTGDSTVADQPLEPWNSWGQMLPRFFGPRVAIANHAQSGESIRSSLSARRFDKVFNAIRPGDFLFIQFGHNDMKNGAPDALKTFRADLRGLIERTRSHGATPVLVTSMERKAGVQRDTLAGYPEAVRETAREQGAALIDLHTMSKSLYRAMGDDLDQAFVDGTHHSAYGSYQLARCVVAGVRDAAPELASRLRDDVPPIDPARPDSASGWRLPESPGRDANAPAGS